MKATGFLILVKLNKMRPIIVDNHTCLGLFDNVNNNFDNVFVIDLFSLGGLFALFRPRDIP